MQNAIVSLFDKLASLLGPLSPFAKAIVPATLALVVAIVNCLFAGKIDATSITIAVCGVVLALVTFLVPNKAKPAPAPAPVTGTTRLP